LNANLSAFLSTIRTSEGTSRASNPYAVCFGYKFVITDFSEHPAVLGTWHGEPLDFLGSDYVGKVSTAAGAYQIIKPTWVRLKYKLQLPDFSPASQDTAAIELISERGALDFVLGGQVSDAIKACSAEWASLPGSLAGQGGQSMAALLKAYGDAGGGLA
jgi:muramidase (phage lysozyme)